MQYIPIKNGLGTKSECHIYVEVVAKSVIVSANTPSQLKIDEL